MTVAEFEAGRAELVVSLPHLPFRHINVAVGAEGGEVSAGKGTDGSPFCSESKEETWNFPCGGAESLVHPVRSLGLMIPVLVQDLGEEEKRSLNPS